MKYIYRIVTLVFATLIMTSCSTSYDEIDSNHSDIIGFTLSVTLELPLSTSTPEINFPLPYFISTASSSERTFHVRVVPEETEVPAESYSFDSTVIIPANERSGVLLFTALNNGLTNDYAPLVLAFEEAPGIASGTRMSIGLRTND